MTFEFDDVCDAILSTRYPQLLKGWLNWFFLQLSKFIFLVYMLLVLNIWTLLVLYKDDYDHQFTSKYILERQLSLSGFLVYIYITDINTFFFRYAYRELVAYTNEIKAIGSLLDVNRSMNFDSHPDQPNQDDPIG